MKTIRFYGKLGDIIYCLALVRRFATSIGEPVNVIIAHTVDGDWSLSNEAIQSILPLLDQQSFIGNVQHFENQTNGPGFAKGQHCDVDFYCWFNGRHGHQSLFASIIDFGKNGNPKLGLMPGNNFQRLAEEFAEKTFSEPWLEVEAISNGLILANRTGRYPSADPLATWREILDCRPKGELKFIGLEHESACFESFTNEGTKFLPTANLLQVACAVSGAKHVLASQSAVLAIAHSLYKPVSVEVSEKFPDCIIDREGTKYFGCDKSIIKDHEYKVIEG